MTEASGGSIWLRPQRAGRGPTPEYTRDQLAAAGVALADAHGLPAVTMRAVATALGTGPASLYRYVATRDELLELMINEVNGEFTYTGLGNGTGSSAWLDDLLDLARQSREIYLRHPWLLDAVGSKNPIGPNAVDYLEHALAALSDVDVRPGTKLEAIGVFSGVVSLLTRMEITQHLAGQTIPQWQQAQAAYLTQVATAGSHPHLAAALAAAAEPSKPTQPLEPLFDRVLTRVLTGLLQPEDD